MKNTLLILLHDLCQELDREIITTIVCLDFSAVSVDCHILPECQGHWADPSNYANYLILNQPQIIFALELGYQLQQ